MGVGVAAVALVIAGLLLWKRRAPKTATVLALIAGAGIGGMAGTLVHSANVWLSNMVGGLTNTAVGTYVPYVPGIIALFLVAEGLFPKHSASNVTVVVAFLLPVLVAGLPGVVGEVSRQAIATLGSAAQGLWSAAGG